MKILKIFQYNTKRFLIVILTAIPLIACAEMKEKPDTGHSSSSGNNISDFQFSVTANKDGTLRPVVTSKDGTQLSGERIPRGQPVKASSIEEMETITVVRAKGSHYFIVSIGGENYKFNLPH